MYKCIYIFIKPYLACKYWWQVDHSLCLYKHDNSFLGWCSYKTFICQLINSFYKSRVMTQVLMYTAAEILNKKSNFKIVLFTAMLPTSFGILPIFQEHSFTSLCFKVEQLKDHCSAHFLLPGNNNIVFSLHCSFSFSCL